MSKSLLHGFVGAVLAMAVLGIGYVTYVAWVDHTLVKALVALEMKREAAQGSK
jgi:hypothetical protein